MLRLARAVDDLYASVASDPARWPDDRLAEWATEVSEGPEPPSREALRQLRSAIRNARKVRDYWVGRPPPPDWAMAIDQALGSTGWAPGLRLAELALETAPDREAFEEVRRRFRMVHSVPWMEGTSFEEWRSESPRPPR